MRLIGFLFTLLLGVNGFSANEKIIWESLDSANRRIIVEENNGVYEATYYGSLISQDEKLVYYYGKCEGYSYSNGYLSFKVNDIFNTSGKLIKMDSSSSLFFESRLPSRIDCKINFVNLSFVAFITTKFALSNREKCEFIPTSSVFRNVKEVLRAFKFFIGNP